MCYGKGKPRLHLWTLYYSIQHKSRALYALDYRSAVGAKWKCAKAIEIDRSNRCLFMNEDLIYCAPLWPRKRFAVPKFTARKWNGRPCRLVAQHSQAQHSPRRISSRAPWHQFIFSLLPQSQYAAQTHTDPERGCWAEPMPNGRVCGRYILAFYVNGCDPFSDGTINGFGICAIRLIHMIPLLLLSCVRCACACAWRGLRTVCVSMFM